MINKEMTQLEKDTQIIQGYISDKIDALEKGNVVLVRGGYIQYGYEERLIDSYCSKIVSKLLDLGYSYTSNHGYGCKDYRFTKKIILNN